MKDRRDPGAPHTGKRTARRRLDYARYTEGDWPSVDLVLKHEWDSVVRIAERCGVAQGERQDVALEVFYRYEEHRWSISSPLAIRSWLRTTAIHASADVRNRKTARFEIPVDPEGLEPLDLAPSPEEQLSGLEGHRALMSLVDALEPGRREVFRRYADQHQAMSLLSSELGIPQGTAYNRLRLAREELKEALGRSPGAISGAPAQDAGRDREAGEPATPSIRGPRKPRRSFSVAPLVGLLRQEPLLRLGQVWGDLLAWLSFRLAAGRPLREPWGSLQLVAPVLLASATMVASPASAPTSKPNSDVDASPGIDRQGASCEDELCSKLVASSAQHVISIQPEFDPVAPAGAELAAQAVSKDAGEPPGSVSGQPRARPRTAVLDKGAPGRPATPPADLAPPYDPSEEAVAERAAHLRLSLRIAHTRLAALSRRPPVPAPPRSP